MSTKTNSLLINALFKTLDSYRTNGTATPPYKSLNLYFAFDYTKNLTVYDKEFACKAKVIDKATTQLDDTVFNKSLSHSIVIEDYMLDLLFVQEPLNSQVLLKPVLLIKAFSLKKEAKIGANEIEKPDLESNSSVNDELLSFFYFLKQQQLQKKDNFSKLPAFYKENNKCLFSEEKLSDFSFFFEMEEPQLLGKKNERLRLECDLKGLKFDCK